MFWTDFIPCEVCGSRAVDHSPYRDKMPTEEYWNLIKSVMKSDKQVLIHYSESLFEYAIILGKSPDKFVSWVYNSNDC